MGEPQELGELVCVGEFVSVHRRGHDVSLHL
jgi:hypothetical protein